ncbi:MAG: transketolase C-terminal domain-containing protein, partial [Elusimicrobiota bacterium]
AEAIMMGMAAGLALNGKIPFVYTINSFLALRAFEQLRDDVCFQNVPVKFVGVGAGLSYGALGCTHHTIEDIAMMRALPNMTLISPCDPAEAKKVAEAVVDWPHPVYVRLAKAGEPTLTPKDATFKIGQATLMRPGNDATIIATGAIMVNVMAAAEALGKESLQTRVINMHTIKPLDTRAIIAAAKETAAVVSVEEHNILGGLGSAVAETILECESLGKVGFKRLGIRDEFCHDYGSQTQLWDKYGLSVKTIIDTVRALAKRKTMERVGTK